MIAIDEMNTACSATHNTPSILSDSSLTKNIVEKIKKRLISSHENTPLQIPLKNALSLVDQLAEFELGRFLLHNRSMNGYWTAYIFRNKSKVDVHPLENWLLNKTLLVRARERFHRFQQLLQLRLSANMSLASIPCGLMDDLLTLSFENADNIKLTGIDLDQESLNFAKENAINLSLDKKLTLIKRDAWNLNLNAAFDIVVSNGLNMYESDMNRNIELYRNFYNALKPNGTLLISFLTPPPDGTDPNDTWANYDIDENDLKQELTIFGSILESKFLNFNTQDEMAQQLGAAGFVMEDINYSAKGILPIAIARKPE